MSTLGRPINLLFALAMCALVSNAHECMAQAPAPRASAATEYVLGAGDVVRITVFQNPDLTTDARVSESGTLTFPLIGSVAIGGLSLSQTEQKIAQMLRQGKFVQSPQVNVALVQIRSSQVAVLGQVNKPGRYPLETANMHLTDMLALAGGIAASGANSVVLIGSRDGKTFRREIDIPMLFVHEDPKDNPELRAGDVLFVNRAPVFYIYGEVQRAGAFRLERNMSVMQGLALGGGLTTRGTIKGLQVRRRDENGNVEVIEPKLDELLKADDVIYVGESLF